MLFWIIILWIVLGVRPSWKNLFILTGVLVAIAVALLVFATVQSGIPPTPLVVGAYIVSMIPFALMFVAIGAIVIWLRGGSVEGDATKSRRLDKEMERIRAEIAARDGQPPGAR